MYSHNAWTMAICQRIPSPERQIQMSIVTAAAELNDFGIGNSPLTAYTVIGSWTGVLDLNAMPANAVPVLIVPVLTDCYNFIGFSMDVTAVSCDTTLVVYRCLAIMPTPS